MPVSVLDPCPSLCPREVTTRHSRCFHVLASSVNVKDHYPDPCERWTQAKGEQPGPVPVASPPTTAALSRPLLLPAWYFNSHQSGPLPAVSAIFILHATGYVIFLHHSLTKWLPMEFCNGCSVPADDASTPACRSRISIEHFTSPGLVWATRGAGGARKQNYLTGAGPS